MDAPGHVGLCLSEKMLDWFGLGFWHSRDLQYGRIADSGPSRSPDCCPPYHRPTLVQPTRHIGRMPYSVPSLVRLIDVLNLGRMVRLRLANPGYRDTQNVGNFAIKLENKIIASIYCLKNRQTTVNCRSTKRRYHNITNPWRRLCLEE